MTINPNNIPPPLFIKDQQQFAQALDDLARQDTLAVDTEANSLYAYQEQVCLIQISTRERDYILDPLTIPNLTPLGNIFWDPEIEKIFHASEYDILILYEDFQFEFQNLFDTMITAQILGRKKLGYDSLLEEIYGVKISKKYQRANWGKRPLSEEMLHYAQVDTHYLIGIREALGEELQRSRLEPIAREDFQRAARVHLEDRAEKLAPCWRINGARQLPPQKAAVLQKLSELRDQMARELDRPLFKVMSTKTLLILAENSPTSRKELNRLQVAKQRNIQRFAEGILAAVREGLQAEPMRPPRRKRPDEDFINREKALKQWRKHTARRMNVNSAVVLPRSLLDNLAAENPRTQEQLARVLQEVPWRLEKFGDEILRVLNKAS